VGKVETPVLEQAQAVHALHRALVFQQVLITQSQSVAVDQVVLLATMERQALTQYSPLLLHLAVV
jgi:hypothetical protein